MSGQSIRMLSIDDRTLTTDLDRAGYRKMGVYVKPSSSYDEANKILNSEEIDIIVINMDYAMIDAPMIIKHLKANRKYAEIPIVVTSVQSSAKIRKSALDAGADRFVEQPIPRQYFIEKLKQLLEQKTRTTERVAIHGDVTVVYGGKEFNFPIGDLSSSGMLISTDMELTLDSPVDLSFALPGYKKPIQIVGKIVRKIGVNPAAPHHGVGFGIRFEDFAGDSEKRLQKYVEKMSDRESQMLYYL